MKKNAKVTAAELESYRAKLRSKTPKQLTALYRVVADRDKKHAIYHELIGRPEVVNVVDTLTAKEA